MDPVLLIFAGVAAFVAWRLFSLLGTRTGHEPRRDVEGVQRQSKSGESRADADPSPPPQPVRKLTPVSAAAAPLSAADPDFDEKAFLEGSKSAYEMIVEAFAAGDLKSIRRFLGQSVYEGFKAAVADRESKGWTSDLKFVGIDKAAIASSAFEGGVMTATVDFVSNQSRVTRAKDGAVVEGDPIRIDLVRDRWVFTRKASSGDPNWTLVATSGAR
jgi:predicted lipid-binding transport protein (Tim44 family)